MPARIMIAIFRPEILFLFVDELDTLPPLLSDYSRLQVSGRQNIHRGPELPPARGLANSCVNSVVNVLSRDVLNLRVVFSGHFCP